MKKVLFGMALGAALSYLFDPQHGVRRREELRERLGRPGANTAAEPAEIDIIMFDDRAAAGVS